MTNKHYIPARINIDLDVSDLIELATQKAKEQGIEWSKTPELTYMPCTEKGGITVRPRWNNCDDGGFEEQAEAFANGCSLDRVRVTVFLPKVQPNTEITE